LKRELGNLRGTIRQATENGASGLVVFAQGPEFVAPTTEVRGLSDLFRTTSGPLRSERVAVIPELPGDSTAVEVFEAVASRNASAVVLVATGWSLVWRLPPGTVVAVRDHINVAGVTPLLGPSDGGVRFVHVDGVYRRDLRLAAASVARRQGWELPEGVYARITEPLRPTGSEARWLRGLGVDLAGNQVVTQSVVAAKAGLGVLALIVVTGWAGVTGPAGEPEEGLERSRALLAELVPALAARAC
jgi:purine-nucleoside phosphorylase